MPDSLIAVAYVVAIWAYQGVVARRRHSDRSLPPFALFPLAAVVVGYAIGEWWAPALALAGLPSGILINRPREPLTVREAVGGTALEALLIGVGCALSRLI